MQSLAAVAKEAGEGDYVLESKRRKRKKDPWPTQTKDNKINGYVHIFY